MAKAWHSERYEREREAEAFIETVCAEHDAPVWAMFSGGDDSLANAIVTSRASRFAGCLHLDTGIGIPETRAYVEEVCQWQGWPLFVYRAEDCGQRYEDLVLAHGFPGPALHYKMYQRLKERALRAFVRDRKRHRYDRLVLSTGVRQAESERRMGHAVRTARDGVRVWANPAYFWSKFDCLDTIAAAGIQRNEVVELLHKSGECLCGSFAKPGELDEIALWYPDVAARIRALEERAKAAGKPCVWGARPKRDRKAQPASRDSAGRRVGPLCQQCELVFTGDGTRG